MRRVACSASSCQAQMIFAKVKRKSDGKIITMPFDADPSPEGTWFLNENDDPLTGRYVGLRDPDYGKLHAQNLLHTPHHATCPESRSFKGPQR